jgi:hypothetical protein
MVARWMLAMPERHLGKAPIPMASIWRLAHTPPSLVSDKTDVARSFINWRFTFRVG